MTALEARLSKLEAKADVAYEAELSAIVDEYSAWLASNASEAAAGRGEGFIHPCRSGQERITD
jgi:hypothetical protein